MNKLRPLLPENCHTDLEQIKVEGEPKKVLEMLAHWESGHEHLFKHLHDKAFELYSGMPWGG